VSEQPDLSGALETVEEYLLGSRPSLTRVEVAAEAGVPLVVAEQLWRLMGFPNAADDDVAFTAADVEALRLSHDLMELGILSPERQAALVRTAATRGSRSGRPRCSPTSPWRPTTRSPS
jgi:adenylate cyclase